MCAHCEKHDCSPSCHFHPYISAKKEQARLNAAHETIPEASKPKRRRRRPNRPEFPNPTRHFVPWFPGRKNGFAQMCACCKTEVAEGAGHIAKIYSTDATWYVFCDECRTTGAMITVPGSDEPEEMTVKGKMKDGMVTFHDIEEAGRQHFARQQAAVVMGQVEVLPYTASSVDIEIMQKISADIERGLNAEFALILNAPVKPGATLQEAYQQSARDILSDKAARLGMAYSNHHWQHHTNSPFPPKPDLFQKPEKPKAHPWRTYHAASASGFKWADSVNHTSERDTMLGAGFGELPPSKMRKHRAKRPKRVGW